MACYVCRSRFTKGYNDYGFNSICTDVVDGKWPLHLHLFLYLGNVLIHFTILLTLSTLDIKYLCFQSQISGQIGSGNTANNIDQLEKLLKDSLAFCLANFQFYIDLLDWPHFMI